MAAKRRVVHHGRRRRSNPSTRSNPGIGGMLMTAAYVGAGMWAGSLVGGILSPITGSITGSLGMFGGLAQGLVTAYAVEWIANRTIGHGELLAAGALAGTVMSTLSGVLSGVSGAVSSLTGGALTAGPDVVTTPAVGNQKAAPLKMVS